MSIDREQFKKLASVVTDIRDTMTHVFDIEGVAVVVGVKFVGHDAIIRTGHNTLITGEGLDASKLSDMVEKAMVEFLGEFPKLRDPRSGGDVSQQGVDDGE